MISPGNFYVLMPGLKALFAATYSHTYSPSAWRDDYFISDFPTHLRPVVHEGRFHLLHASARVSSYYSPHHGHDVDASELAQLMRGEGHEDVCV